MRVLVPALALAAAAVLVAQETRPAETQTRSHTVSPGENLSYLALVYNVPLTTLAEVNGIEDHDLIFVGQTLTVPDAGGVASAEHGSHTVMAGDTLSGIAAVYGVSVGALQAANGITDPNLIFAGQVITVPAADTGGLGQRPESPYLEPIIEEMAAAYGVDAGLVKALAWVESGWQQDAVSPAGAVGVMQIMPDTAAWLQNDMFGFPLNWQTSTYDNVKMGVHLLALLLDVTGGDLSISLASYYQGLTPTQAGVWYQGTAEYVDTVLAVWQAFWP